MFLLLLELSLAVMGLYRTISYDGPQKRILVPLWLVKSSKFIDKLMFKTRMPGLIIYSER